MWLWHVTISLVLLGNKLKPMRSINRDSGMGEKSETALISWMEQVSMWDHSMDPVVQLLPK